MNVVLFTSLVCLACGSGNADDGSTGSGTGADATSGSDATTSGDGGSSTGDTSESATGSGSGSGTGDDPILVYYYAETKAADMGELWAVDLSGDAVSAPQQWAPPTDHADGDAVPSLTFIGGDRFATFRVDGPAVDTTTHYLAATGTFPPAPPVALMPPSNPAWTVRPAVASDGARLAVLGGDASDQALTLYAADVDADGAASGFVEILTGSSSDYTHTLRFSPTDGDRLFFVADDGQDELSQVQMVALDEATPTPTVLSNNADAQVSVFYALADDGEHVAYGQGAAAPYALFEVDLTGAAPGSPVEIATEHQPAGVETLRYAGGGKRLLYFAERDGATGEANLFARPSGSTDPAVQLNDVPIAYSSSNPWGTATAHPGGDLVVYRGFEVDGLHTSLYWVDASAASPASQLLHDPLTAEETVSVARFTADGDVLYYVVLDRGSGERAAFSVDTSGATPGTPAALDLEVDAGETLQGLVEPSPDGVWLAYRTVDAMDGFVFPHIWLHEVATGDDFRVSLPDQGDVGARLVFTAGSTHFVFGQAAAPDEELNLYYVPLDAAPEPGLLVTDHLVVSSFFWTGP